MTERFEMPKLNLKYSMVLPGKFGGKTCETIEIVDTVCVRYKIQHDYNSMKESQGEAHLSENVASFFLSMVRESALWKEEDTSSWPRPDAISPGEQELQLELEGTPRVELKAAFRHSPTPRQDEERLDDGYVNFCMFIKDLREAARLAVSMHCRDKLLPFA